VVWKSADADWIAEIRDTQTIVVNYCSLQECNLVHQVKQVLQITEQKKMPNKEPVKRKST